MRQDTLTSLFFGEILFQLCAFVYKNYLIQSISGMTGINLCDPGEIF